MKHTHEITQTLTLTPTQKKYTKICTTHQNIYEYMWWTTTLRIFINTHPNDHNIEHCNMYHTPKYLWCTCDDL
jgi:hypothetical protein